MAPSLRPTTECPSRESGVGESFAGMKEFVIEVPLRWGDMDAMSHLNNLMYFR